MWFRNSGGFVDSTPGPETSQQVEGKSPESEISTAENEETSCAQEIDDHVQDDTAAEPINGNGLDVTLDQSMDPRNDMMTGLAEENVTSLFFDPSLNIPDPSLDFEWLFDNVSTEFNANGDLPAMVSPESSISGTHISPPSFPMHNQGIASYPQNNQLPSAPWVVVQGRLVEALSTLAPDILMSPFFYPTNLAHFYDLYFQNYHPHFPILHKPTLDPTSASPLLVAAIVTLGSTLSSDAAHFETAVNIHDSLRYIIFNVRLIRRLDWLSLTTSSLGISSHLRLSGVFKPYFSYRHMRKCSPLANTINWHIYFTVPSLL